MNMAFGTNKTPVKTIKRATFGGTYFRNIYSVIKPYLALTINIFDINKKLYWLNWWIFLNYFSYIFVF